MIGGLTDHNLNRLLVNTHILYMEKKHRLIKSLLVKRHQMKDKIPVCKTKKQNNSPSFRGSIGISEEASDVVARRPISEHEKKIQHPHRKELQLRVRCVCFMTSACRHGVLNEACCFGSTFFT